MCMVPELVIFIFKYFFSWFSQLLKCGKSIYTYQTFQIISYSTSVITLPLRVIYHEKKNASLPVRFAYRIYCGRRVARPPARWNSGQKRQNISLSWNIGPVLSALEITWLEFSLITDQSTDRKLHFPGVSLCNFNRSVKHAYVLFNIS
jgi:hypothetical protein